jgi:transposase-like protein
LWLRRKIRDDHKLVQRSALMEQTMKTKKYLALRIISVLLKIAGVFLFIVGGIGLLMSLGIANFAQTFPGTYRIFLGSFYGILWALPFGVFGLLAYAFGDLISVFIDIEANTRILSDQRAGVISLPVEGSDVCPKCGQANIERYERSREGEEWVCRNCNHSWHVAAEVVEAKQPSSPLHVGSPCPKCKSIKTLSFEETIEHIGWNCNDCGYRWQQHLPTAAEAWEGLAKKG